MAGTSAGAKKGWTVRGKGKGKKTESRTATQARVKAEMKRSNYLANLRNRGIIK